MIRVHLLIKGQVIIPVSYRTVELNGDNTAFHYKLMKQNSILENRFRRRLENKSVLPALSYLLSVERPAVAMREEEPTKTKS